MKHNFHSFLSQNYNQWRSAISKSVYFEFHSLHFEFIWAFTVFTFPKKKLTAFFGQILLNLKILNRVKYLESSVL